MKPPIPKSTFFSPRVKHDRGTYIVKRIEVQLAEFQKSNGARIVIEDGTDASTQVVKLIVPPVPLFVPIGVGEALHNLRGALDHLISAIVTNITNEKDYRVNFPFHEERAQLLKMEKHPLRVHAPDVWDIVVNELRPYRDGDGVKALWALNKLNNTDKHRLLLTCFDQTVSSTDIYGTPPSGGSVSHYENLRRTNRPGEYVLARGRDFNIRSEFIDLQTILVEPDVISEAPVIPLLNEFSALVLGAINILEAHVFGQAGPGES